MTNDQILNKKKAWRNSEERRIDRRKKIGTAKERNQSANAIKHLKNMDRGVNCSCSNCEIIRMHLEERQYKHNETLIVILIFMLLVMFGLLFFSGKAHAQDIDIGIISQIESGDNPEAFNSRSGAIGLCQITPIVLKEFNERLHRHYDEQDLYIEQINLMIGEWYINKRIPQLLKYYHIKDTTRNRLVAYNAGISAVIHGRTPTESKNYIVKYEEIAK